MSEFKFEIGDKVRVLDGSGIEGYCCGWTDGMSYYVGKVYNVTSRTHDVVTNKKSYILDILDCYSFDERGLELVEKRPSLYERTKISAEDLKQGELVSSAVWRWAYSPEMTKAIGESVDAWFKYRPKRILKNGRATIVMWADGTKTVVHKAEGAEDSPYAAFTAALAIKCYGSNSAVNRIVRKTEQQKSKKEKAEEKKRKKTLSQLTEEVTINEVTINLVQMKCENCNKLDTEDKNEYSTREQYFCTYKGKYVFPDKSCGSFQPKL